VSDWIKIENPVPHAVVIVTDGWSVRFGFWQDGKEHEAQGSKGGGWRDNDIYRGLAFLPTHYIEVPSTESLREKSSE